MNNWIPPSVSFFENNLYARKVNTKIMIKISEPMEYFGETFIFKSKSTKKNSARIIQQSISWFAAGRPVVLSIQLPNQCAGANKDNHETRQLCLNDSVVVYINSKSRFSYQRFLTVRKKWVTNGEMIEKKMRHSHFQSNQLDNDLLIELGVRLRTNARTHEFNCVLIWKLLKWNR